MTPVKSIDWIQARRELAATTRPHLITMMECGDRLKTLCHESKTDANLSEWLEIAQNECTQISLARDLLNETVAGNQRKFPPALIPPEIFCKDQATVVLYRWDFTNQLLWRLNVQTMNIIDPFATRNDNPALEVEAIRLRLINICDTLACLWALYTRLASNA